MRKILALMLALMLIAAPALAATKQLDSDLFADAKEALGLMGYGETKKALKMLGLASDKQAVVALEDFLTTELADVYHGDVQTDVAVCYETKKWLKLALPVEAPSNNDVQTLILRSKDGQSFVDYQAMCWGDVQKEIDKSKNVVWNEAYEKTTPVIVADD